MNMGEQYMFFMYMTLELRSKPDCYMLLFIPMIYSPLVLLQQSSYGLKYSMGKMCIHIYMYHITLEFKSR